MLDLSNVPGDFDDFLLWLKERTEAGWANYRTMTFDEFVESGVGGRSYRAGTKWRTGLSSVQIDALEQKWNLKFPPDYRQFLATLNAPDRGMYSVGWIDEPPYDMQESEDEPSYYDWQRDDEVLKYVLQAPLEGILYEVDKNSLWLEGWGERPRKLEDALLKVRQLAETSPPLIPITGHRYLLGGSLAIGNPVLSMWDSDIIIYAANLKNFLILEFSGFLDFEYRDVTEVANEGVTAEMIKGIPFWGDIILRD